MSTAHDDQQPKPESGAVPYRSKRLQEHQLEAIVDLVIHGRSYAEIERLTGIPAQRIENLVTKGKNKKFNDLLRDTRFRTETAGINLMKSLYSPDNINLVYDGIRNALTSTDDSLRYDASKDMASMFGVFVPRDQMKGNSAVQVNVGGPQAMTEEQVRTQQALAKSTSNVLESMARLASSLPDMSNNPHITVTGTGPALGDESDTDATGVIDIDPVPAIARKDEA